MNIGIVVALVILALLLGGVGLAVEALRWLLIVAVVLFIVSALAGWRNRRK
jgi:hypothetical protein